MTRFVVMAASAQMPSSARGMYRKVAIVQLKEGFEGVPRMISERARGVERIVWLRDRLHARMTNSRGGNTAYEIALRKAERVVDRLNSSLAVKAVEASGEDLAGYVRDLIDSDRG